MIDREKEIKALRMRIISDSEDFDTVEIPVDEAVQILELLKEQPEIIQCKDCKHREYIYSTKSYQCPKVKKTVDDGWFCADGERRVIE